MSSRGLEMLGASRGTRCLLWAWKRCPAKCWSHQQSCFCHWAGRGAQGGFAEQGAEEQSSVCARWVPSCQPKGTEAAFGPSFTRPGLTPALGSALPSSSLEAAEQQLLGLPAAPFGLPQHFPSHFPAVFS